MSTPTVPNVDHSTAALAGPNQPILQNVTAGMYYLVDPQVPGGLAVDTSSIAPGKYLLGLTLNRVLDLLTAMIQSIQSVSVEQANRLNILTAWQQKYTDLMNNIHTFTANNGDAYLSATDTDTNTLRQNADNMNSNYLEQLRSNNQLISDAGQALETNLNQSQNSVNQQSNFGTSIYTQLNTLLTAIYSG